MGSDIEAEKKILEKEPTLQDNIVYKKIKELFPKAVLVRIHNDRRQEDK